MIDIQAVNDGDLVEVTTMFGNEIGIYKGQIAALPDTHEVWVMNNPAAARLVRPE